MEKQVIQSVGFRNLCDGQEVTGFQFKVRLPYYRGIYLSQIRPGTLTVDGETFTKDDILWNIKGVDYTWQEMTSDYMTFWETTALAVLKVKKPGGLSQGFHDLTYGFCFTSSYMPPIIQAGLDPDKESFVFMPEFGHHVNFRRLLIV